MIFSLASDIGKVRKNNEDFIDSQIIYKDDDTKIGIFALADGMGGHNKGEVASAMAVNGIIEFLSQNLSQSGNIKIDYFDDIIKQAVIGPSEEILTIKSLPLNEKLVLWKTRESRINYYTKMDISEYLLILEKIKKRIIFYGVLDNLDNAIKSERISPLTGKIVGALNFNVIINIGNNVVKPIGTAKGYDTALASIQNLVFDRIGDVSKKSLFIGHANNLPKAIIMKNIMTKYNEFESVHIVEVGASIGTYTGEGAILVSVL